MAYLCREKQGDLEPANLLRQRIFAKTVRNKRSQLGTDDFWLE